VLSKAVHREIATSDTHAGESAIDAHSCFRCRADAHARLCKTGYLCPTGLLSDPDIDIPRVRTVLCQMWRLLL
jgi:hypothetical protein